MCQEDSMLKKVFEPIKIKNMNLKNRLVVSAMSSHLGREDGTPNEAVFAYLDAKVRGEWGLIFTEDLGVTQDAGCDPVVGSLWNDAQIPAWADLVQRIHAHGGVIAAQIYHAGRERTLKVWPIWPVAPSAIREPAMSYVPRELTAEEIHGIVKAFADAARRCVLCGFDMVEIHGAHGYLVNSFMSAFSNHRTDEYGGSLLNRMRFPLEIVAAVRQAVGPDYPICFRMNTCDYVEGGITLQESVVMAQLLEQAGVDVLHCSQGMYASKEHIIAPSYIPAGAYIQNTAAIKSAVRIPVIAVGRINDVLLAESVLTSGSADLVAMARASLADPELPRKAREGKLDDIIRCIGCDQGCTGEAAVGGKVNCLVNPHTARETAYDWSPVNNPRKVLVAGAGVSGLSAAIAAAERGHQVEVYERSDRIGGQWIAAAAPPGKADYIALLNFYERQCRRYHVTVHLNTSLTEEVVSSCAPDVVILATGSTELRPPIPGLDNDSLVKGARDILCGKASFGKKAIVVGGGSTGAETAAFMAMYGSDVTIIEMGSEIIADAVSQPKACLKTLLEKYHVKALTDTKLLRVADRCVIAVQGDKEIRLDDADTVVLALGARSYDPLSESLASLPFRVIRVGDALKPKNGYRNIREGFEAGNSIN